eukprot:scaffold133722_cov26-Tisochrysis_lutea.AAC.5
MREAVVKSQPPAGGAHRGAGAPPSVDIARTRTMFGLSSDQKLLGVYQCSVRREVNAVKEVRPRRSVTTVAAGSRHPRNALHRWTAPTHLP